MSTEALCVRVLWGDRRVAAHVLNAGEKLALSQTGEPSADGTLRFEAGERHFAVGFHEGVVGEVLRNGETPLSLGEAVHRGLASEAAGGWSLDVGRADVVRVGRGPVHFEAFRVNSPKRTPLALDVDYRFLNTLLLCFALFGVVVMQTQLEVPMEEADVTSGELTRMRRILVQSPPPPPKKRAPEQSGDATPLPKKIRMPAEGTPRNASKPRKEAGGSSVAQDLSKQIFGGPGASGVLGTGGLGQELRGAMGSVVSANGDGLGGWSLRGNGTGGPGGDRASIGAIPTSGVASKGGIGTLCGGPGPCKQTVIPEVRQDPPILCVGCLDKELIRKVIASHRDQIRFCYELALQQSPSLAGKVSVQFLVSANGTVAAARVEHSTVPGDTLGDCLVSRVRSWTFPRGKVDNGGYRVTYPFVFKPSGS
jgi:TonB family protein